MWKGVAPLLAHHAATGIARIAETHAAMGRLPAPQLPEPDASTSRTAVFDRVAASYDRPSKDCEAGMAMGTGRFLADSHGRSW